ncbi:c-type cytochrome [Sphingobium estronivorans]|uniref:c-type cytochrome n=1 Tax=Sphingobium estronivorans TaxID=1577690 RepID=UPI0012386E67|nr:cytochrome c [Sphingobium estronivorans]
MSRALPALLLLTACNNMVQQPRYDAYEKSSLFPDGKVMQAPPDGTVARDEPEHAAAARRPAAITPALLARGKERYGIYCAICHGADGRGDGYVTTRGFPHPPSYLSPRLRIAPASHFYDVITHGYGIMYAYADRIPPADRWAIAAHIRVLQAAQPARDAERGRADAL